MQNKSFFNLKADLAVYLQRWQQGWTELCATPVLRRLLPSVRVRVIGQQRQPAIVTVPGFDPVATERKNAGRKEEFAAVALPESAFLQRKLNIPVTSIAESRSAMQLEVEAASPFSPEQTVWGWRSLPAKSGFFSADVVISSRALVGEALDALNLSPTSRPEIWAPLKDGYAVISGFGEASRLRRQKRQNWHFLLMLGTIVVLLLALAVTPLIQKRFKVVSALSAQAMLVERSGPVNGLREHLNMLFALHETLGPKLDNEPNAALLLDQVSAVLPDGAWLSFYEYTPTQLRLSGYADDATALQRKFQEQPGFSNVRQSAPIVRDQRLAKDRFTFDLDLKS